MMEYMIYPTQATLDAPFKRDFVKNYSDRINAEARVVGIHTDKQRMLDLIYFHRLHNDVILYQREVSQ